MDGGKQLLALVPETNRLVSSPGGWVGRLQLRAEAPAPAAIETGWAAKLTAHVRQAGGLRAVAAPIRPAAAPEASPIGAFLEALTLLKEQLLRERQRADAAEASLTEAGTRLAEREAALAAAEARLAEAVKRVEKAEKEAQAAQQGLRRLRKRGLIARILNAD
ncbi:hypothetical protein JMJ56_18020 [Belnapia sp. T18]|uniref:Uncharacterized protein n=1 Tax=Belnapia arida TaxID=2804533 RepID=A0ABS1U5T8_9PROT|nr:hypothetical protein [Belnapia arida]MBL6079920.1 hypothetical protein [Belnapia arida]